MRCLAVLLAIAGCGASSRSSAPAAAPACLADGLGKLSAKPSFDLACVGAKDCPQRCASGAGEACLAHAYALQADPANDAEVQRLFGRACVLGVANACTNYGAILWIGHQPASPADTACAKRLFERSCDVREPFACGMRGRMMAESARTDEERTAARAWFDRTCNDIASMTCRMYALHLELDQLGAWEPATVKALMLRACETGDDDACGHETAAETFH